MTTQQHGSRMLGARLCAFLLAACSPLITSLDAQETTYQPRRFKTGEVFSNQGPILFQSNFAKTKLHHLNISLDNRYALPSPSPGRLDLGLPKNLVAAKFTVPRKPNHFRSELSLPHEPGFQERWYGISLLVPKDWQIDPNKGADIVIQWHAIPGNGKPTHPNLDIAIHGSNWEVRQATGSTLPSPTKSKTVLKSPLQPGTWTNWIIHAIWSPHQNGLVKIWQNNILVYEHRGPNVYNNIGVEYTPYLKCGIYHPEWFLKSPQRTRRFNTDTNPVSMKQTYVAKIVVADKSADKDTILNLLPTPPK